MKSNGKELRLVVAYEEVGEDMSQRFEDEIKKYEAIGWERELPPTIEMKRKTRVYVQRLVK